MRKLFNYKEYIRLSENLSVFGLNHTSATGVATSALTGQGTQANDPNLTTDGYDRHKNNIINAQNRLIDILQSVFKTDMYAQLKSVLDISLEFLKINQIFRNASGGYDIYIEFELNGKPDCSGVFKNWGSNQKPVFKTRDLKYMNKMQYIKITGLIKYLLETWFKPDINSEYTVLNDYIEAFDMLGKKITIKENSTFFVDRVIIENDKPVIYIIYNEKKYKLRGKEYYYFNYYNEKK